MEIYLLFRKGFCKLVLNKIFTFSFLSFAVPNIIGCWGLFIKIGKILRPIGFLFAHTYNYIFIFFYW